MSIVTKTGDKGTTGLMYGQRVMKDHPRIEAFGNTDELNAALGLVRAAPGGEPYGETVRAIQEDLVAVMGELAVQSRDRERYVQDKHPQVTPQTTARLDDWIAQLEAGLGSFKDWVMPGANPVSAALDMARTVCRRAERSVCSLQRGNELQNAEILVYLNRLSDFLWLLARRAESPA